MVSAEALQLGLDFSRFFSETDVRVHNRHNPQALKWEKKTDLFGRVTYRLPGEVGIEGGIYTNSARLAGFELAPDTESPFVRLLERFLCVVNGVRPSAIMVA